MVDKKAKTSASNATDPAGTSGPGEAGDPAGSTSGPGEAGDPAGSTSGTDYFAEYAKRYNQGGDPIGSNNNSNNNNDSSNDTGDERGIAWKELIFEILPKESKTKNPTLCEKWSKVVGAEITARAGATDPKWVFIATGGIVILSPYLRQAANSFGIEWFGKNLPSEGKDAAVSTETD